MFDNWINPKASKLYVENQSSRKQSCFVENAQFNPKSQKQNIAIIGAGESTDAVRNAFYNLDFTSFNNVEISDLGDVRNNDPSLMTAAYKELISQDILPIIIDSTTDGSIAVANALKALEIDNFQGIISPRTDINYRTFNLLTDILEDEKVKLLSILGYQKHYANPLNQNIPYVDEAGLMSLGNLRDNFKGVEPLLRDLTCLHFDVGSIRASDSYGLKDQSNFGFTSEESCRLLHYACSSNKMKAIHISGFELEKESKNAAELLACLVWYSILGRQNCEEHPQTKSGLDRYVVELSTINDKIQFWKNQNSERWWVEIPNPDRELNLVPCSEDEYQMACKDKISDRLFFLLANR